MALFVVERDLSSIPPERLRLDQREIASACLQLKAEGKRIRYISSAVMPVDGRAVDLFGAASAELVKQAHQSAAVPYTRIAEVLDLTPSYLHRGTSRSRHSLHRSAGGSGDPAQPRESGPSASDGPPPDLTRWLADGQRFFSMCVETLDRAQDLQTRKQTLESENGILREEVGQLRHRLHALEADRSDLIAALGVLADQLMQLDRIVTRRSDKSSV